MTGDGWVMGGWHELTSISVGLIPRSQVLRRHCVSNLTGPIVSYRDCNVLPVFIGMCLCIVMNKYVMYSTYRCIIRSTPYPISYDTSRIVNIKCN